MVSCGDWREGGEVIIFAPADWVEWPQREEQRVRLWKIPILQRELATRLGACEIGLIGLMSPILQALTLTLDLFFSNG